MFVEKAIGNSMKTRHAAGHENIKLPTALKFTIVHQLCNHIPNRLAFQLFAIGFSPICFKAISRPCDIRARD
jgi:hypothetical protein